MKLSQFNGGRQNKKNKKQKTNPAFYILYITSVVYTLRCWDLVFICVHFVYAYILSVCDLFLCEISVIKRTMKSFGKWAVGNIVRFLKALTLLITRSVLLRF